MTNTSRRPSTCLVDLNESMDIGTLYDWYISSVGDDEPIWTEKHIEELFNDFYLIPKETVLKNDGLEPLSLTQLKHMEGEPVWVKVLDRSEFADPKDAIDGWGSVRKSWVYVSDSSRDDLVTVKYQFEDYETVWVAYSKRP